LGLLPFYRLKEGNFMRKGHIHSIESCGTVDGPGIRYVIFFQGCPMRCQYCHNPDTWDPAGGTLMTVKEVLDGFYTNLPFYRSGGVTVTGGEPLVQIDFLTELFENLKSNHIHTCIDTSGITFHPDSQDSMERLDHLLSLTDLVMLDIKHINDARHQTLTGHSNQRILDFAHYLDRKNIPVWIRHVLVPGITFYREYLEELGTFMASLHNIEALDVLPYHSMGTAKYASLGISYPLHGTPEPSKADAQAARNVILSAYQKARTNQNQ